ncbi:MAG: S8 family serine peptidase [Solirubrobacterales bacterium]
MAGLHKSFSLRWTAIALTAVVIAALPGLASASTPAGEEALVVLRDAGETDAQARDRLREALAGTGLEPERVVAEIGAASVDLPAGETVAELTVELESVPGVLVEPNLQLEPRLVPSDPAYSAADPNAPGVDSFQWNLRKSGFERAWGRSDGSRARVAVIDSGIEGSHPDLGPRIESAVDNDNTLLHGGAKEDENGHGSHVAGLACGQSGDGFGIASAGYACDLLIYKSDLSIASISESIVEAIEADADVINMSFGGPGESQALENAIDDAAKRDVILVAAAENEDTEEQGIPADYLQPPGSGPDINAGTGLVVTAAQYDGARASFLPGRGSTVSLAAYGSAGPEGIGIFSSFPAGPTEIETLALCGVCRGSLGGDNRFAYLTGTSMATPQVAGAAALIRSKRPRISATRVAFLLKQNARRAGGFSDTLGWGVLNANRARKAALKRKKKGR